MAALIAASTVLHHTTAFLGNLLSQPDLLQRTLSSACHKHPYPLDPALSQASELLSQSLENSLTAERLLLSLPVPSPLSSLLLSLTFSHRSRHVSAGLCLLDVFVLDPALARSEVSVPVFECLFIPHLVPAIQFFTDRRSRIVQSGSRVLSRMSGGQAEELRELERGYEEVMDENCRVYAEYLKKVLEGSEGVRPPELVFERGGDQGMAVEEVVEEEKEERIVIESESEQYNNVLHLSFSL